MLVLNANQEQKRVFHDLIQQIDTQVVWNGRFIMMGDRLILEGIVRSLVLHLDIQQAEVKLADLPTEDEKELEITGYPGVQDLITAAVYAFQKWGILDCFQVQQDVKQLEQLFAEILGRYQLDIVFTDENMEFYRSGMRITYEDAAETILADTQAAEKPMLKLPVICSQNRVHKTVKVGAVKQSGSQDALAGAEQNKKADAVKQSGIQDTTAAEAHDSEAAAQKIEKYHARIGVLDRLSVMQKKALVRDIRCDSLLNDSQKAELYDPIQDYEYQERMHKIEEELQNQKYANYAHTQKMMRRADKEEWLFETSKAAVMDRLKTLCLEYGRQEVRAIMEQTPAHVERAEYSELMEKLAPYEEIDTDEYKETLRKMRETLEIKEISNMLTQSQKKSRKDFVQLLYRMEEQHFAKENAAPYVERILDWIGEFDQARLNKLLSNIRSMDFETAASLYEMIAQESFLPKARAAALTVVSSRLEEICLGECRILVHALKKSMSGVIRENPAHYFYPAEQMLQKTVKPEEIKTIDNAVSAYAEKKGIFEYPIFIADTSKEQNGRDGMLLTPEHLFYSTRLSSYRIKVPAIRSVYVSAGLLNHKSLIAEERNGTRHKLPYVTDTEQLQDWAKVLEQFIRMLQARPVSEKLTYDALLEYNTMSCVRCGCVYRQGVVCPECGLRRLG